METVECYDCEREIDINDAFACDECAHYFCGECFGDHDIDECYDNMQELADGEED